MEQLPNDVLELIYKMRHNLEIKDINKDIQDRYHKHIITLLKIILQATKLGYWSNNDINFEQDDELRIYATMRNMGYIDNNKLLILIRATPLFVEPNEEDFWMNYNNGPSIFELVKIHDDFIPLF